MGGHGGAQQALSCVYRTGQRFGAGHVIDVLLGRATDASRNSATTGFPLSASARIATKGNGARCSGSWSRSLPVGGRRSVRRAETHAELRQVLKGETSVMLREQAARPARVKRGRKSTARETASAALPTRPAPCTARLASGHRPRARRAGVRGVPRRHHRDHRALRPGTREALRGVSGWERRNSSATGRPCWKSCGRIPSDRCRRMLRP